MDQMWKGSLFVEKSAPLHSGCWFYNLQLYYFGSESALTLTCFRTKQAAVFRKKSFNKPTAPKLPSTTQQTDTAGEENGPFSS